LEEDKRAKGETEVVEGVDCVSLMLKECWVDAGEAKGGFCESGTKKEFIVVSLGLGWVAFRKLSIFSIFSLFSLFSVSLYFATIRRIFELASLANEDRWENLDDGCKGVAKTGGVEIGREDEGGEEDEEPG
jgi:hypothetical protein